MLFIEHFSSLCLRESTNISLALSHTDAKLVHGLSQIAGLQFLGHEVPSLQVYAEGKKLILMLSDDEGPIVSSS